MAQHFPTKMPTLLKGIADLIKNVKNMTDADAVKRQGIEDLVKMI
jgi:Sec-independent protein translocase protein TatA